MRILVFILIFLGFDAVSGPLYIEIGAGVSRIHKGQALFGTATGSPKYGLAANGRFGWCVSHVDAPLQFHLGVSHRLNTSSADGYYFGTQASYFGFRLETHRFNLGTGFSPLVWKEYGRDSAGGSGVGYSRALGSRAAMAEFNLLWRIIPDFSIALGGGSEWFWTPSGVGPKPAWSAGFQFRFYFPFKRTGTGSGRKPDGWRYPFGVPLF